MTDKREATEAGAVELNEKDLDEIQGILTIFIIGIAGSNFLGIGNNIV